MSLITAITGIVATVALLVSLILLMMQVRELISQTKTSNSIGTATVTHEALAKLHNLYSQILKDPRLYPYFFEGKSMPQGADERVKVVIMAEMMADVVDFGVLATSVLPEVDDYAGWSDYGTLLLQNSPAFVEVVSRHPSWFPHLRCAMMESGRGALLAQSSMPANQAQK